MASNKVASVIVLWDLEGCFPYNQCASDAVSTIRTYASTHGSLKKLKAFWNPNRTEQGLLPPNGGEAQTSSNSQEYRDALQLQGIDLVGCGFLDGENVVKAMLVDILIDIVDLRFSAPPSILIISPNSSLRYLSHLLQDRHFTVVVLESWDTVGNSIESVGGLASPSSENGGNTAPSSTGLSSPPLSPEDSAARLLNDASWAIENMDLTLVQKFNPLIEVLHSSMSQGERRISRANLGNMLTRRCPTVYTDAGVNGFKKYVDMAAQLGVVDVGGGGTGQWVELKMDMPGYSVSSPSSN